MVDPDDAALSSKLRGEEPGGKRTCRDPVMDQLLTPPNTALLDIDDQPRQVQTVTSIDREVLVDNIISVARPAETLDLSNEQRRLSQS